MSETGNSVAAVLADCVEVKDATGKVRKMGLVTNRVIGQLERIWKKRRDTDAYEFAKETFRTDGGDPDRVAISQHNVAVTTKPTTQQDAIEFASGCEGMEALFFLCLGKFEPHVKRDGLLDQFTPKGALDIFAQLLKASGFEQETGEKDPTAAKATATVCQ